jgi:Zn-dependent peptidase ImmA (M78 family)
MEVIQGFAEKVAKSLKFHPGDDLEPIVASLGGEVLYQPFSELERTDSGSIVVERVGEFTIYLPDYTSPSRDRFSIAHELGHYFLHFPLGDGHSPMKAARYGSNRVEWEANWFAAAFLMPKKEFLRALAETDGDLDRVARQFKVSRAAADIRRRALS